MSKVNVIAAQVDDFIELEPMKILNWHQPMEKLLGFVKSNRDYNIAGITYRLMELYTEKGIKYVYLGLTQEITKIALSQEEFAAAQLKMKLSALRRTVQAQGSDPEIFIVNKDKVVIPSFLFLKGKDAPNRTQYDQPVFWDGFQAEFNTPGGSCLDGTVDSVWEGLKTINELAKKYDKDARLTIMPTLDIPPHMLVENKDEHVQFGCMPSKNVYNMKGRVADGKDVPFRSAGGHIHLQLDENQKKRIPEYVKALDAILGVACVSFFGEFDDPRRREYYGLAGEYRTPKHGMEYRPLSNVWMAHPTSMYIVFELARKVISLVDEGLFKHWDADESEVIECINTCNIPMACALIGQNEEMFKGILHSFCYQNKDITTVVFNAFMHGIENLIKDVDDVAGNWELNKGYPHNSKFRISQMESNNSANFKNLLKKG